LASPAATIATLKRWGLYTNKALGQHLLIDDGVVGRILRLAAPLSSSPDEGVLEIGPGVGTLTEALLAQGVFLLAIEKDARFAPLLEDLRERHPEHFDFLVGDAVALISQLKPTISAVVANLPYAVAATLVLECFEQLVQVSSVTVMVQREVAARMAAHPGSRDYGAYTVKLQLLAQVRASFSVARENFLPPPRVDSTVIRLDRSSTVLDKDLYAAAVFVADAAFAERRKTIRNSMRSYFAVQGLVPQCVDELLAASGIDPKLRGEALTLEEYLRMGSRLHDYDSRWS
jgi:16S rRNA (adenine1518-N6/adenine1519-N6)-dimethyltransferase